MKKVSKDKIEGEYIIVRIRQPNTEQSSYLFCDKIWYMHDRDQRPLGSFDHHLMIYNKRRLIFKVWLPNEEGAKEFKDVKEALRSVGMEVNHG